MVINQDNSSLFNSLQKKTHLCLAPMQGITNVRFRSLIETIGGMNALYTEFFNSAEISFKSKKVKRELLDHQSNFPLIVQIIGSDIDSIFEAIVKLTKLGIKNFNLNAGCPYGKLAQKMAGGKMMKNPLLLQKIIDKLRPLNLESFSVKIRAGYDTPDDLQPILDVLKDPFVSFVIVHARFVKDGYKKKAQHEYSAQTVAELNPKPVIINGDIKSPTQARLLLNQTKASGLMIGRGAIQNPWIFSQIEKEINDKKEPLTHIYSSEVKQLYILFKSKLIAYFTKEYQLLAPLKEFFKFLSELLEPEGKLRLKLLHSTSIKEFENILITFLDQKEKFKLPL